MLVYVSITAGAKYIFVFSLILPFNRALRAMNSDLLSRGYIEYR